MKFLKVSLFIIFLSLPSFALYNTPMPVLDFDKSVIIETRLQDSPQKTATENISFSKQNFQNKDFIVAYDNIEQKMNGENYTSATIAYYKINNNKLSAYSQSTEISKEGNPYQSLKLTFDWDNMTANFNINDHEKGKSSAKTFTVRGSFFYIQNLIKNKIKSDKIKMIVPNGDAFPMELNISYIPEEITIKDKKISCLKVKITPSAGLFSSFVKPMYFWYKAEPPYSFVRYEGLERGPNSPYIIQEVLP